MAFESTSSRVLMECGVCSEEYNDLDHKPVVLKCSHSFCLKCLKSMVAKSQKRCPLCRREFQASSPDDLIINRNLLDLVNYLNKKRERRPEDKEAAFWRGSPDGMWKMSKENAADWDQARAEIQEVFLINKRRILELQKLNKTVTSDIAMKLKHVVSENNKMIQKLEGYNTDIGKVTKSVSENQAAISAAKDKLRNAKNFAEYGRIMDDVNYMIKSQQVIVREMTSNMNANKTLHEKIKKEHTATGSNIGLIQELLQGINLKEIEGAQNDLFPELGAVAAGVSAHKYISVDDLRKTKQQVYAVTVINGRRRFAKIVKSDQNPKILYVHRLKDEPDISPSAQLIKYEEVTELTNYCDRLTFMDLEAKGKPPVRIVIKYYSEINFINHVKNHILLCTGERGPTYAKSKVLEVKDKGKPNEFLILGDFEKNNGSAGRAIVSKAEGNEWWKNGGSWGILSTYVCQRGSTEATASQFCILTRKGIASKIFAYVRDGLSELTRYVQECDNAKEIEISDCGRVVYC